MSPSEPRLFPDPHRPGAWTVRVGGADQSYVDPHDPTHLEFDYVQRIAEVVDVVAPPGERIRVVHVGGAGMTLPRYISHTRPTSAQVVLEPDEELTAEVREKAPLPPRSGIKVRPVGGREGLAAMPDDYVGLLVIDAFAGARVPGELVSLEAFGEYHRVLDAQGVLVMNVTDAAPLLWTRRVLAAAQRYFGSMALLAESSTLKGRRFGNLVVVAERRREGMGSGGGTGGGLDWDALVRRAAGAAFPFRVTRGEALSRFVGSANPMFDPSAEQSPPPPGGRTAFR